MLGLFSNKEPLQSENASAEFIRHMRGQGESGQPRSNKESTII